MLTGYYDDFSLTGPLLPPPRPPPRTDRGTRIIVNNNETRFEKNVQNR